MRNVYKVLLIDNSLRPAAHYSLPAAHYSLSAAHCSLLTAHYLLLTAHCSLFTAHSPLPTPHSLTNHCCSPFTSECSLLAAHSSLLTTHFSFPIHHSPLLTPHSSLLTPYYPLLTAHDSLFTPNSPNSSILTAYFILPIAHCSLLTARCPLVMHAQIADPDNLDTVFGNGDVVTVRFAVDTSKQPVASKEDIDKLLTFCTACNPGCARSVEPAPLTDASGNSINEAIDADYNGLGTEYSGEWIDHKTLQVSVTVLEQCRGLALASPTRLDQARPE